MTSANRSNQQWLWSVCLLLLLSGWTTLASASESVAKIIFAINGVEVIRADGAQETALKGTKVFEGDTVVTAAKGRAQLLFVDGARTALRPGTELVVEKYQTSGAEDEANVVVASENSAVLGLLKGGMRAVSGNMTKANPEALTVKTPVATMGIRGTDFTLVLTSDAGNKLVLYVAVRDGVVRISNSQGEIDVAAGEFATALKNVLPRLLLNPPAVLFDEAPVTIPVTGGDGSSGQSGSGESGEQSDEGQISNIHNAPISGEGPKSPPPSAPPSEPSTLESPPETDDGGSLEDPGTLPAQNQPRAHVSMSGSQGDTASDIVTGQAGNTEAQLVPAANGGLREFVVNYDAGGQASTFSIVGVNGDTAAIAEVGSNNGTGFEWGRWHDGTFTASPGPSGSNEIVVLNGNESVHWVYGLPVVGDPLANITGFVDYEHVGGTSPTSDTGAVGILQEAFLRADFSSQLLFLDMMFAIDNHTWIVAADGQMASGGVLPFTGGNFQGDILDGTNQVVGVVTAGAFGGSFSPNTVDVGGFLVSAGAGLTYSVAGATSNQASVVSGAAVFANPAEVPGGPSIGQGPDPGPDPGPVPAFLSLAFAFSNTLR